MSEGNVKQLLFFCVATGGTVGWGIYLYTNSIWLGVGFGFWSFWTSVGDK